MGVEGSGKSIQAGLIAKEYGLTVVSTGDACREEAKKDTSGGKEIRKCFDAGTYVSDDIVNKLMLARAKQLKKGFVMEGYPRKISQAEFLDKHAKIDKVFFLDIPDAKCKERLLNRIRCPECGEIYNLETKKPKKEMLCDKCGTKLERRPQDTPSQIDARMHEFHKLTEPILSYYGKRVVKVNAARAIEDVFSDIKKHF